MAACLFALLLLTGCGLFASGEPTEEPLSIRTPKPTFTPTPTQVAVMNTPAQDAAAASEGEPDSSSSLGPSSSSETSTDASGGLSPIAVITGPLVNVRSGPSTDFEIVTTVERGAQFDIIGRNAASTWWQICCADGQNAWVIGEYVDTDGAVDSVAVAGEDPAAPAPQTPQSQTPQAQAPQADTAPTAAPPAPTPVPTTAAINFTLEAQEQFPETGLVRVYLYVNDGSQPLEGYSLRITKDGQDLPVSELSFGGQPAFTWPFQDVRQRYQNFKVEYPDVTPAGRWELQLVNADGAPVGPVATFTLSDNDPQQELYVRYVRQ